MYNLPDSIKQGIDDYARSVKGFIEGEISWARFSGVRVPWGNYSHRGGKVFMARVRIPAGVVTPKQLKALAYCAQKYGNRILHITTRQDIQIHEVRIEDVINIHHYLKEYQLSSRGGGGNTVRNITVCPLSGICTEELFDVREDAISLTEYLLSLDDSYNMPRKLKIAFSGCSQDCVNAQVNDVGLAATSKNSAFGYKVYVGGGMGAKSAIARPLEEFIERRDLGYIVSGIKAVFYKYGNRRNKHHNRLRFLIQDIGFDKFKKYYKEELGYLRDNKYISLRRVELSYPQAMNNDKILNLRDDKDFKEFLENNCQEQKQKGFVLVKLRIPRGDLKSNDANELADLANVFKHIEFRTSNQQNLYVANIPKKDLYKFYESIKNFLNDFLYPSTLLDVVACKGSLTCNLGLCNSPGLAKEIEALINRHFIGTNVFKKLNIKINGCPNACGHHPIGIIALHGVVRKVKSRPVPFYRLLLGGRKGFGFTRLAKDTQILIPARNVPLFLKDFLLKIDSQIGPDTDIHKFIEDKAENIASAISSKYSCVPDYLVDKNFYIDWGSEKEFSLEGLGPGECGAGILDMINADLTDAKVALQEADKKGFNAADIKRALVLTARALLVVKGCDPKDENEVFNSFRNKFIDEKIVSEFFSNIKDIYTNITQDLNLEQRKNNFLYAKRFFEHIDSLYKGMDSSFNFPKLEKEKKEKLKEKTSHFMDLKGTPCPINYVKVKLFLENLNSGDILEVFLDEGEPIDNVPKSLRDDGHKILKIEKQDGFYKVVVQKRQTSSQ